MAGALLRPRLHRLAVVHRCKQVAEHPAGPLSRDFAHLETPVPGMPSAAAVHRGRDEQRELASESPKRALAGTQSGTDQSFSKHK